MPSRRFLRPLRLGLVVLAAAVAVPALAQIPNSVGLLHFDKKNFRAGDWVLYEVRGSDITGQESVDFQRIQVAEELEFRGEDCFWLETGWGQHQDSLHYTAVLVSEEIFKEEIPAVRYGVYIRRMMVGMDHDGVPRAMDLRLANPSRPLPDLGYLAPRRKVVGKDTVTVAGKKFVCDVIEESREVSQMRDMPDSTARFTTETRRTLWVSPDVPITGLLKQKERKVFYQQIWPLGKPSKDFPTRVGEVHQIETRLMSVGAGAAPQISHRLQDAAAGEILGDPDAPR